MNDEQYLLASAYLDGDVTPTERAHAEADNDVMQAVAAMRSIGAVLADAPAPAPAVQSTAIRAALAEFDATYARHSDRAVAPVVAVRSVRWGRRYLAVAAGLATVAGLGVLAANLLGDQLGGDNDSAGTLADERFELAAESAPGDDTTMAAESAGDAGASAITDVDDAARSSEAPSDPMGAADTTSAPAQAPPVWDRADVPPVSDPTAVLTSPAELTGLGLYLLAQADAGTLGPTPEGSCSYATAHGATPTVDPADVAVLATARYQFADGAREVLVAVDHATGQTFALDGAACAVLVDGLVP